jgi:NAD(P)-dependent dehydrogenase (short-subunit alcohol dehydrogenase family)
MRLAHKTALITGATTGIGFQTAQLFIKEGARVFITGQDAARLASAAAQLGNQATALYINVLDLTSLDAAATQIKTQANGIDILFANAGVAFATPVDTTPEARFDELMDTNVKGVFFTVQKFAPLMGQGGSIILNTSWLNQVGTAGLSALSASKAAVRSFTRYKHADPQQNRHDTRTVSPVCSWHSSQDTSGTFWGSPRSGPGCIVFSKRCVLVHAGRRNRGGRRLLAAVNPKLSCEL